ncbi:MAG TPA: DUF2510 domain-containing protein, partial [Acidimicrobiales bacterium]
MNSVPGWYRDPSGQFPQRWWDGSEWTSRVMSQGVERVDLTDSAEARNASSQKVQIQRYLDSAFDRGLLDPATHRSLRDDLATWDPSRVQAAPSTARSTVGTAPAPPLRPVPAPPSQYRPPPPVVRATPPPPTAY